MGMSKYCSFQMHCSAKDMRWLLGQIGDADECGNIALCKKDRDPAHTPTHLSAFLTFSDDDTVTRIKQQ